DQYVHLISLHHSPLSLPVHLALILFLSRPLSLSSSLSLSFSLSFSLSLSSLSPSLSLCRPFSLLSLSHSLSLSLIDCLCGFFWHMHSHVTLFTHSLSYYFVFFLSFVFLSVSLFSS